MDEKRNHTINTATPAHATSHEHARSAPSTGGPGSATQPPHFPEIFVYPDGTIALCPGCAGSDASRDGEYYICRVCGSVWRAR